MEKKLPVETAVFILNDSDILAMVAHNRAIISNHYIADKKIKWLSIAMWGTCVFTVYEFAMLNANTPEKLFNNTILIFAFILFLSLIALKKYLNTSSEIKSYIDDDGWYKLEQIVTVSDNYII